MTKTQKIVKELYKDDSGKPLLLTEGQDIIFNLIFGRKHPRNNLMCYTRYGKSFTVALAVLTRVATFPEKWAIIAPSEKKARIIMSYIIEHIFDNELTKQKFMIDKTENVDRIRRERNKNRINFKHSSGKLGEIFILSADQRNKAMGGDALMGFGSANVILDEAALIDDDVEAKIFRMLGDQTDNFYLKIGNPFKRNHFYKSHRDPLYNTINIDYPQGIKEGRITQEFIDEAKNKPFFDVLYNNIFPDAEAIDDKGYSRLITDKEFDNSTDLIMPEGYFGIPIMGVDIARGGGNSNVWVVRHANYAFIAAKNQDSDLMNTTGAIIKLAKDNKVSMPNVCIDDIGVGSGVVDRLREQRFYVKGVKNSEVAEDFTKFKNKRAENAWKAKEWLMSGGKLRVTDDWTDCLDIKYKTDSAGKLQIMPKEEMRRNGIMSPDVFDALCLTFDSHPFSKEFTNEDKGELNNSLFNKYDVI